MAGWTSRDCIAAATASASAAWRPVSGSTAMIPSPRWPNVLLTGR